MRDGILHGAHNGPQYRVSRIRHRCRAIATTSATTGPAIPAACGGAHPAECPRRIFSVLDTLDAMTSRPPLPGRRFLFPRGDRGAAGQGGVDVRSRDRERHSWRAPEPPGSSSGRRAVRV